MSKVRLTRSEQRLFITAVLLSILIVVLIPSGFFEKLFKEENPLPEGTLEVHFIDVGQGDGILIRTGDGDIVIDAGTSSGEQDYLRYLKSYGVNTLEYLVLTHPHNDHIGGADLLLEELEVKRVVMPNTGCTTSVYLKVKGLIEKSGAEVIYPKVNDSITLGAFTLTTLAPLSIKYDNYNDYSVVMRADYGDASFLFVGDAEAVSEKEILGSIPSYLIDCDVLKVGHHGSKTSSTKEFLLEVSPEYAVISCGENNEFGHPHDSVLKRFAEIEEDGKLYRTDKNGHIVFVTDGEQISVSTEK